jgi:hypothetical protein
MEQIMTNTF